MRVALSLFVSVIPILLLSPCALAQGLLGIGRNIGEVEDFEGLDTQIPFNFSLTGGVGWDSNANTASRGGVDSGYLFGGIGVEYGTGSESTQVNADLDFNKLYYFDDIPGLDDDLYSIRLTLDVVHRAKPRLTIANNTLVAYEIEPDYTIGASSSGRAGQYLYFYNRIAGRYQWRPRVAKVLSYAVSGIMYDSAPVARVENRYTHLLSDQLRYALTERTSLTAEYRYQHTEFDGIAREINSHFILLGIDHRLSQAVSGTVSAGAEIYNDSTSGGDTKPSMEGALIVQVSENTSLRWVNRLGFETNELSGFGNRYGYRTGLSAQRDVSSYLRLVAGLSYALSKLEGVGALSDVDEEALSLDVALVYRFSPNAALRLGYQYTDFSSDLAFRSYARHGVSIGVSVNF